MRCSRTASHIHTDRLTRDNTRLVRRRIRPFSRFTVPEIRPPFNRWNVDLFTDSSQVCAFHVSSSFLYRFNVVVEDGVCQLN